MDRKKINEILRSHEEWVTTSGEKGKRANLCDTDLRGANLHDANLNSANLCGADLRGANLCRTDLYNANLCRTDLRGAYLGGAYLCVADLHTADLRDTNLRGADLREANLYKADLRGANLGDTDLRGASLYEADLRGAILPKGIYVTGGAGSEQRYTYYDAVNDRVICGCWDDDAGNHLDSFRKRIEDVYGEDGKTPNTKHYKAYQAVIRYFESCRDAYEEE